MSNADTDCIRVLTFTLDLVAIIRRDERWTRSGDADRRCANLLDGFVRDFLPLCSPVAAAGARALIAEARAS